jgi:molybdopterin molybdotransferase
VANFDLPPFDNSAMDGFAVHAADTNGASESTPVHLRVVGEVPAGASSSIPIAKGEAVRITTGARLPVGADAVIPVEDTSDPRPMSGKSLPERVEIWRSVESGAYVRRSGQDVRRGSTLLRTGHRLGPADLAMLAAIGVARPRVHRRPRVAIFSSGDELLEPGEELGEGQIRDSNSYGLVGAVARAGGVPVRLGIAADEESEVKVMFDRCISAGADLILSSAGVSMGAHDYVRVVLEEHGRLDIWRVNMRPGKPLAFGSFEQIPFFGLPGNPVSALVSFEVFVRPAIAQLEGAQQAQRVSVPVRLQEAVRSDGRESYLRAVVWWEGGEYHARLTGSQDSGVLSSMIAANAYLVLPAGVERMAQGEQAQAWLLDTPPQGARGEATS